MINRRKSILNKTRRDSVRSAALKLLQQKEENENNNSLLRQRKYENLDDLKIKEDDLNKKANNPLSLLNVKSAKCAVRRLIPLDQRRHFLKGVMLKHSLNRDVTKDYQMFSSLNGETDVKVYENHLEMQTFTPNKVSEKKFLKAELPNRPVEDNSFKSLKNWKLKMLERRKLKTSLAKRLQSNPESLLMSRSAQSALFSSHQDEILKIILPYFQNGTGAPITHSIWPVQEETANKLYLQRYKWKPHLPLRTSLTGYHDIILSEMDETAKDLESSEKIKMKNKIINNVKYQKFFSDYQYNSPDISELIISPIYLKGDPKKENTFLNIEEEEILIELENFKPIQGPTLLINDELIFERLNESDQTLSEKIFLHIHFPATITGIDEMKNLYLANRGSCVINYSWKKIEIERYLKTEDIRPTFFFKINKGIVLPDSNTIIPVTFKSKCSGFFDEMWELVTSPMISSKRVLFHFHAISLRPDYLIVDRHLIGQTIAQSATNQIAKEIVDDLVRYAVNRTHQTIEIENENIILNDEDIFKAFNPEVFWNFEIVQELKLFTLQNFEIDWDLSLGSLKQMLREKCDFDSEIAEPLFENYQKICQGINFPAINPISIENDLFNLPFDTQNICFIKLMNSIDEAENFMIAIVRQLNLEKRIYNITEDSSDTSVTLPDISIANKDNIMKLSKGKSDQKSKIVEPINDSAAKEVPLNAADDGKIEFKKFLFREKAYYTVANVINNLLKELDHIFDRIVD